MAGGSGTTTGYENWPIIFYLTETDASYNSNRFMLISTLTDYMLDHLDNKDAEALTTHCIETQLLDSDNNEKAYPGCQLTATKINDKSKIQYQYYLQVTKALVEEKDLKEEDLVGFKYDSQRSLMLFSVLKKGKNTIELRNEGAKDSN